MLNNWVELVFGSQHAVLNNWVELVFGSQYRPATMIFLEICGFPVVAWAPILTFLKQLLKFISI